MQVIMSICIGVFFAFGMLALDLSDDNCAGWVDGKKLCVIDND